MNIDRFTINWKMVETLAYDLRADHPLEWHEGAMLEQLMHWYASRDERFSRYGFQWSQPDGFIIYCPAVQVPDWDKGEYRFKDWGYQVKEWYVGEAAIAAFLGLEIKGIGLRMKPTQPAIKQIYKHFGSATDAVDWIGRQIPKHHGMTLDEYRKENKGSLRLIPRYIVDGKDVKDHPDHTFR